MITILGDLMDEESVLDFLTSLEAMDLPDRIEEVNQKILSKIIDDTDYVAVLFCKYWSVLLGFCTYILAIVINSSHFFQLTNVIKWFYKIFQRSPVA